MSLNFTEISDMHQNLIKSCNNKLNCVLKSTIILNLKYTEQCEIVYMYVYIYMYMYVLLLYHCYNLYNLLSSNNSNGSGTGDIFFGETDCLGNELSLIQCETDIHNRDLCDHQHDVWITCCKYSYH